MRIFAVLLTLMRSVVALIAQHRVATYSQLSAATLKSDPAPEAVTLAECPLTVWGEPISNILEMQEQARQKEPPFLYELSPPEDMDELSWLNENADWVKEHMLSHGAVFLKGWKSVETPQGFRAAYEALDLSPCLDPLHAVSARPTVASGVYEAVNKESRSNFFIGMHNEFVGTRSPRAAMFVCFKAADEGGEFLLADGRKIFRDVDPALLDKLYSKQIRYSVMELPFFGWVDNLGPLTPLAAQAVQKLVSTAVNLKVDFDVSMQWLEDSAYDEEKTLQARAPKQPPVVRHPTTGTPTWFCNVHSHSSALRNKRQDEYGAERFESGASRINKSDMYYGDDLPLDQAELEHLDAITNRHIISVKMRPGDAILLDNYQTMHGRNVFKGSRKHAVTWFE